jgi:hypothetical protein
MKCLNVSGEQTIITATWGVFKVMAQVFLHPAGLQTALHCRINHCCTYSHGYITASVGTLNNNAAPSLLSRAYNFVHNDMHLQPPTSWGLHLSALAVINIITASIATSGAADICPPYRFWSTIFRAVSNNPRSYTLVLSVSVKNVISSSNTDRTFRGSGRHLASYSGSSGFEPSGW